jgi:hypothetical protein
VAAVSAIWQSFDNKAVRLILALDWAAQVHNDPASHQRTDDADADLSRPAALEIAAIAG